MGILPLTLPLQAPAAKPTATTAAAKPAKAAESKAPAATGGPSGTLTAALKTVWNPDRYAWALCTWLCKREVFLQCF
ncbi:MAG: hypothetical protein CM1200mP39_26370 [Dehalococcoidia bacterium]|nr:MAG: hypothetical protein CM1200mP39_26370 [Dehalococcoidia bacterium]